MKGSVEMFRMYVTGKVVSITSAPASGDVPARVHIEIEESAWVAGQRERRTWMVFQTAERFSKSAAICKKGSRIGFEAREFKHNVFDDAGKHYDYFVCPAFDFFIL